MTKDYLAILKSGQLLVRGRSECEFSIHGRDVKTPSRKSWHLSIMSRLRVNTPTSRKSWRLSTRTPMSILRRHVSLDVCLSCQDSVTSEYWHRSPGTGTQPDYLANHADQNNEGPCFWTKRQENRELATEWAVGGVEAHGQLMRSTNVRLSETKYKRSQIAFAVTSIAFNVVHICIYIYICTELLQFSAQSLIDCG